MADDLVLGYDEIDQRRKALYQGLDQYYNLRCHRAFAERSTQWARSYASIPAYLRSIEPQRRRLAAMIGYGGQPECDPNPAWEEVGSTAYCSVRRLWLNILPGVRSDALYLVPHGDKVGRRPLVIAQHGLNGTPEECCGLVTDAVKPDYSYHRIGLRLAERGFVVLAPHMVGGYGTLEGGPRYAPELGTAEWAWARTQLYRKAYLLGENLFGTELMGLSRLLEYASTLPEVDPAHMGIYGLSQGGQTALFWPAVETRLAAAVSSAWFQRRIGKMIDYDYPRTPFIKTYEEDKFFPGWLACFDDSDIVSLICPRAFAAETGQLDGAVWYQASRTACEEAAEHYRRLGILERIAYYEHASGHIARGIESVEFLARQLELGQAASG